MNVLLTSAGRRTSLLQAFQSCVHESGGRVWAGDVDPLAPALQVADASLVLPPIDAADYLSTLLDHVRAHDLDLVVPLLDPGLRPLAEARNAVADAGCTALVSDPALLDVTLDKWPTMQHFSEVGVRTPASWRPDTSSPSDWPDPVFVKPRRGSASRGARRVSHAELPHVLDALDAPMLQEVIDAPEITVDALFDLDGTLVHYVPRLRVRTRAGESIQGRTLSDDDIGPWLQSVLREVGRLGARGPITLQAFLTEPEPTLSEINARFGGGFPLAHAAGGHYPEWIVQMCRGETVAPRLGAYTADLCMTRAYTEWFVPASALADRPDEE
jgi:carbamoyl-phosphate synthase large subunit